MKQNKFRPEEQSEPTVEDFNLDDIEVNDVEDVDAEVSEENSIDELEALKNLLQQREQELEKEKKEYLYLMADFDNFKKRTLREKAEIIKNGAEAALRGLLPIIDDFERGLTAIKDSSDVASVKEGMELIYNKFIKYLESNGVKPLPTVDVLFNDDLHEAIAMVPATDESQKGKVVDTVEKGYTLNDKVLRHAKVVVAQ